MGGQAEGAAVRGEANNHVGPHFTPGPRSALTGLMEVDLHGVVEEFAGFRLRKSSHIFMKWWRETSSKNVIAVCLDSS